MNKNTHYSVVPEDFKTLVEKVKFNDVLITDKDGTICYVNPRWEEATGWKSEEVLYKVTPRILTSGKHPKEYYEILWKTILSGDDFHGETINKRKDGKFYNVNLNIYPIKNTNGQTMFIEISSYITDQELYARQQREAEEKRFKELTDLVDLKTKTLQEKINELENMNKFMIGRELKMIELKKEIADLREKLKINK